MIFVFSWEYTLIYLRQWEYSQCTANLSTIIYLFNLLKSPWFSWKSESSSDRDATNQTQQVTWFPSHLNCWSSNTGCWEHPMLFHDVPCVFSILWLSDCDFPIGFLWVSHQEAPQLWGISHGKDDTPWGVSRDTGCPRSQGLPVIPSDEVKETCGWKLRHCPMGTIGVYTVFLSVHIQKRIFQSGRETYNDHNTWTSVPTIPMFIYEL